MNNSEIFLLSLINQSPRYGYEISQFLEETNAGLWINISMPYVYRLLKSFEERGLVSTQIAESKNRPNRTIYQITVQGSKVLIDNLNTGEFIDDKIYFSSDVALAISAITNIDFNLPQLIANQIQRVKAELEQFDLQTVSKPEVATEVKMAHLIIEHRIIFLQAELQWLQKVQTTVGEI